MNKIKSIIHWFKTLNHIIKHYDLDFTSINAEMKLARININEGVRLIKERTNVHASVGCNSKVANQIIVIGRYNNRDYIETYNVYDSDFKGLIMRLKEMEKYGTLQRVDAPYSFSAVIDKELSIL